MEVKRDFLTRFLLRKQVELSEILSSRRTRSYARSEVGNNAKFVRFKEKTYQITEYEGAEDVISEDLDENVLIATINKEIPRKLKGPCPIKCGKIHVNSSLFFVTSSERNHRKRGRQFKIKL